jgi:cytochrome c556
VPPVLSVNAVMVGLIDHAGHALWDVEKEGRAPKTDDAWQDLEHHAMQIAAAGSMIALGGTGQADPGWAQLPDWKKHSQELADAGLTALSAARAKNLEALVKANGQLVDVCERCHKEFKPSLPTEGIVHPHHAQ